LDAHRKPTHRFKALWTPQTLNEWGALGGLIGKKSGNLKKVKLFFKKKIISIPSLD
jgi:hypothetical protein